MITLILVNPELKSCLIWSGVYVVSPSEIIIAVISQVYLGGIRTGHTQHHKMQTVDTVHRSICLSPVKDKIYLYLLSQNILSQNKQHLIHSIQQTIPEICRGQLDHCSSPSAWLGNDQI